MNRTFFTRLIVLALVSIVSSSASEASHMTIQLKDNVTVHSERVVLSDICDIECRDLGVLAKTSALELHSFDRNQLEAVAISQRTIRTHLLFAGLTNEEFSLVGAASVNVSYEEPILLTDADIEKAALQVMVDTMGIDERDFNLRLQKPFMQSLPGNIRQLSGLQVEVIPPRRGVGQVNMQVQVWKEGKLLSTRSAMFDIRKRHRVAIARISLSRDVPLDDRSVQFESRFLSTETDELDASQVLGQRVRTNVVAGTVLQLRDLQTTRSGTAVVVRKGESIRAIAVAGKLQTVLRNAEALQDGGIGETIRLLNRDSRQEFTGTILGPGKVRIEVR